MAGTDRSRTPVLGGPAVILVTPQLGENIGAVARAMLNFGLGDLRLVRPREPWPSQKAMASASGAGEVVERARLFGTTREAMADLAHVFAATARRRDMAKEVLDPPTAAARLRRFAAAGETAGLLFGPERTGLGNDDVGLADAAVIIPANPAFASLNLAQAVVVLGYEWFRSGLAEPLDDGLREATGSRRQAPKHEVVDLFDHLERELDAVGFLTPVEKRPRMVRNLRNIFLRSGLTEQDVRSLRGVIVALTRWRVRGDGPA